MLKWENTQQADLISQLCILNNNLIFFKDLLPTIIQNYIKWVLELLPPQKFVDNLCYY
jgi:hypothetical protein